MSGILSRISEASPWLDDVAASLHKLTTPILGEDAPKSLKDALYGVWLGHPLHPVMTDVTLAGFVMSMVFDVLDEEEAADISLGVGTLTSVGTAISGAAQWYDLQNMEEPKRIGALHAALNSTALGFYATSLALRRNDHRGAGLATAWTGHALSLTSAWIGGHLSFVSGIGVNRNAFTEAPEDWTDAIAESDLPEGTLVQAEVDGEALVFLRQGHRVLATSNVCTHVGGPLNEGKHDGACVTCPWHGSVFDMETGAVVHGPATSPVDAYETRISGGTVQVRAKPNA